MIKVDSWNSENLHLCVIFINNLMCYSTYLLPILSHIVCIHIMAVDVVIVIFGTPINVCVRKCGLAL